jgi:hypothetical protein
VVDRVGKTLQPERSDFPVRMTQRRRERAGVLEPVVRERSHAAGLDRP